MKPLSRTNLQRDTYAARRRSEDYIARERGKRPCASRDRTCLLSTDPNFDPWRDAGVGTRKLEPAR